MDLRILTATIHAARDASDCAERSRNAAQELDNACAAYDDSRSAVGRIHRATDRLCNAAAAFSRCADAAYDNANDVCED